jgi:Na+-driven multidrug efflux pump
MKSAAQLAACILLAWAIGWFALAGLDQSDRDMRLPPKPVPKSVEMFLLWLPFTVAIAMSGNAHDPSQAGIWIGLVVQWTAIGFVFFVIARFVSRFTRKRKSSPENA